MLETLGAIGLLILFILVVAFIMRAQDYIGHLLIRVNKFPDGPVEVMVRKDDGRDDQSRGILVPFSLGITHERTHFESLTPGVCPMHGEPYTCVVTFHLEDVSNALRDVYDFSGTRSAHVVGCNKCFRVAVDNWDLEWLPKNYAAHPVEFGAQLYPHLRKPVSAKVFSIRAWIDGEEELASNRGKARKLLRKVEQFRPGAA